MISPCLAGRSTAQDDQVVFFQDGHGSLRNRLRACAPARIAEAGGNGPADRQPGRYHSRAGDPGVVGVGNRPPDELFVVRPSHRRKMIAVARRTSPACHRLGTNNQVGSGVRRTLGSDIGSSPNAKAQRTGSPRFKLSFPQLRGCGAFQLPQYPWVPQSVGNSSAVGHHRPGSVPPDAEGEPARAANSPTSRRPWASAAPSRRPPPSAPAKVPAAGRAGRAVSLRRGRGFPDCHYITVFSRSGGSGDRAARQDLARVGPTHRRVPQPGRARDRQGASQAGSCQTANDGSDKSGMGVPRSIETRNKTHACMALRWNETKKNTVFRIRMARDQERSRCLVALA